MDKLDNLIKDFISWKMKHFPTISTLMGYDTYNDKIEDYSSDGIEKLKRDLNDFSGTVNDIVPPSYKESYIDYSLLKRDIKNLLIETVKIKSYKNNPTFYSDIALQSIHMLSKRPISHEEKIECIIKRMEQIPELFNQGRENLHNPPSIFLEAALNSCAGGSRFISDLVFSMSAEFPEFAEKLNKQKDKVLNAFEQYSFFLKNDLSKKAEGNYAVGKELFDELLYGDYMLDYNSEEVFEKGYEVFQKTKNELEELAFKINPYKSWQELYSDLRAEHPAPENVVKIYSDYMEKAREFVVKEDLVELPPDQSVEVKPTPEFMRLMMPTAAYQPVAIMDKVKKGTFWVTPVDISAPPDKIEDHLREHNIAEIVTTTLHEAYPGHHLQLTYGAQHPRIMRRHIFTPIFAEGWALYCEQLLVKEYGYLNNIMFELAWLRRVLWRSLRVMLDVSLHTRNMTVDEAVSLMVKELLFSEGSARGEVIRYTMTPTQPLSYLIGKLEILKLREEYKNMKGADFCIKDFHKRLLSCGTLPIRLLRKAVLE